MLEVWPGSTVTIKTTKNLFTANKVILTAGKQKQMFVKTLFVMFRIQISFFLPCTMYNYFTLSQRFVKEIF